MRNAAFLESTRMGVQTLHRALILRFTRCSTADRKAAASLDFDSAGPSWRAIEPSGVLRFWAEGFRSWLGGYRSVRAFSEADEAAVAVLAVVADFRVVTWKLGLAVSSQAPLLQASDLPEVVDGWVAWEREHPA